MLSHATSIARRSATVLVTMIAWLALSNHCVLGSTFGQAEVAAQPDEGGCPMHAAPAKKKPALKTPCCKEVRAVVAKCVAASPPGMRLIGSCEYSSQIFVRPARVAIDIGGLDTGPPGCFSFAESVLQESMLSHAPPLS